ncbi:MAG: M48 family metallopeptidase [Gemmatimonadaceae bacterium]|nr:M48 family metallopeptidase [Gemmatimonadaceae bacterium]
MNGIPVFSVPDFGVQFAEVPSPFDAAFGASVNTPASTFAAAPCTTCGGNGATLPPDRVFCGTCRWLRPLNEGYVLPVESFLWRLDADAMNVLRSLGPLTMAARAVSERVGRPWFEASVNGLRLGEQQLPDIFALAIRAARTLALPYMPEIYISGEQMWDANTLGTDTNAFIVLGSVLINFKEDELLFVLGREMGRVRAGHALWRTVTQLLTGRTRHRSILGDGVLRLINPAKLAESALDAPLMAWSRHSEITADHAGMLCVPNVDIARRVLTTWTLKSFPLQSRINAAAWREQEASVGSLTQVAEWTLSNAPYLAGRLRLLDEFANGEQWGGWRRVIEHWMPPAVPAPAATGNAARAPASAPPPDPNTIRLVCPKCNDGMRIPRSALAGDQPVNVRCPNATCRTIVTVTPRPASNAAPVSAPVPVPAAKTPDPAQHAEG